MEPPSWHPLHSDWLHWNHLVHWNQSTANDLEYRHALQKRTEIEAQVARGDPAESTRIPVPPRQPSTVVQPAAPSVAATSSVADAMYTSAARSFVPPPTPSTFTVPVPDVFHRGTEFTKVVNQTPPVMPTGIPDSQKRILEGGGEGQAPTTDAKTTTQQQQEEQEQQEQQEQEETGDGGEAARRAAKAQAESDAAKLRALQEANAAAKLAAIELAERKAKEAAHWNAVSRARQQSKKADLGVRAGEQQAAIVGELATLPTPYGPDSPGQEEQTAFNAAIEEMATKLATTEDEMRKTQALMVGLEQARIDTEQQQAAAAQQLQAIGVFSDPRASFFEQFSRAPRGTPIQVGPELSAAMRGQTIPAYGEIRHYTEGQPQLATVANDPVSIRRAFEGAVDRLTTESIQNLSPRAVDQMSVLGQIGGYFPTDVFRAREAAIPTQPRLVRSMQIG